MQNSIKHVSEPFGTVPDLFMNMYSEDLDRIFRTDSLFRGIQKITVYLEYYGEHSFAGIHDKEDEKTLTLIDVFQYKKDFVKPKDFIETFHMLGIPEVIYSGEFNSDLITSVYDNAFKLKEGVVAKGVTNKKVWMNKIKTKEWLDKVLSKYGQERLNEEI